MQLRGYQQAAINAVFAWWEAGRQGEYPLICLPTGGGKTVVFAHLIKRLISDHPGISVLVLAHRKELIAQAESKLKTVWPDAPCGVYSAALGRREIRPITIASRDTIASKIDEIGQFTFVIVDESHNINQKEEGRYRDLIGSLKARYEHLQVIGFTATPFRLGQGKIYGPGKFFAGLAYQAKITKLIEQKYLAPLTSITGRADSIINTEGVRTVGGDFDEKQLAEIATVDALVEAALADWREKALDSGRKATVFFCVSVLHAMIVSEKLARKGIECPHVSGETPAGERDAILQGFERGDFPAVANVGVLTEGWDCPRVDCIAMLRPTQSAALYVQMVGRGMRLHPGKENCLVLDYGGNIQRLGPVDQADEPEPVKRKKGKTPPPGKKHCGEWGDKGDGMHGWINGCGAENHPGAKECCQCGAPFISHQTSNTEGGILTTERRIVAFPVEGVSARQATSNKTGQKYLRIAYRCGLLEVFYRNIMLGYDGYAGDHAARLWREIAVSGEAPASAEQAEMMLEQGTAHLLPVESISVDVASRWKDIVAVNYRHEMEVAA